jgi:hypothetical protein
MDSLNKIPNCLNDYYVNILGKIVDKENNEICLNEINGKQYINLNWYGGIKNYETGLVVLASLERINVDIKFFNNIKVLYKDGDCKNTSPINLTFVFNKIKIESNIRNFFIIPDHGDYAIDISGNVVNLLTGKIRKWNLIHGPSLGNRKPGYKYTTLYIKCKERKVYQHRVMCLVFKEFDMDYKDLVVNHIDGNKQNNHIDNLEWTTYSKNNKHAWQNGLRNLSSKNILIKDLLTNKILSFKTIKDASIFFGDMDTYYICKRLKDKSNTIYPDYLLFKYDDDSAWVNIDITNFHLNDPNYKNYFVARNVFTGDIVIFENVDESMDLFSVPPRIVLDHSRNNKILPYNGYNFRFRINANNWPEHSYQNLKIYKERPINPKDGILMFDTVEKKEIFFTSINECIEKMKIKKAHLNTIIYTGRLFKKRYSFRYYYLRDNIKMSISSEASL